MKEADLTIFEYRKEKNIKNTDAVIRERLFGKFEKGTVRTDTSGYVDFSIYRPEKYVQEVALYWDSMNWMVLTASF